MKVAIIEDEPLAAEKLEHYLKKYKDSIEVVGKMSSIDESVTWIKNHQQEISLFFMDIQLTDGLSFEIFNEVEITKPVIFTTAFDEFAIDAFKVNSIDYLLKPITFTDLSKAMRKLAAMKTQFTNIEGLNDTVKKIKNTSYKDRFLVNLGNHIHAIKSDNIAFFYAEGRDTFLISDDKKKYMIPYTLEHLQEILDPRNFFRVNRSFIIHLNAIKDVLVFSNRRLKLRLFIEKTEKDIIVSREKVPSFKQWFEGN